MGQSSPSSETFAMHTDAKGRPEDRGNRVSAGIGLLIEDSTRRGMVESAAIHLKLTPMLLTEEFLALEPLAGLALVVADEAAAQRIRSMLAAREAEGTGVCPAIVAVIDAEQPGFDGHADHSFDALLPLPQAPTLIAAQLRLILHSHRAFARRYQSAIEELHLNRRIFRSVTSGISVVDATLPDLPLTYVNPAFEMMTGYCREEVLGKNCRFLQGPEHDQAAVTLLRDAIREHREVVTVVRNFHKDGTPFWNELSLSPIRNRAGELTHYVGIQTDVTARVGVRSRAAREREARRRGPPCLLHRARDQ